MICGFCGDYMLLCGNKSRDNLACVVCINYQIPRHKHNLLKTSKSQDCISAIQDLNELFYMVYKIEAIHT